jgi:hypothetical protein
MKKNKETKVWVAMIRHSHESFVIGVAATFMAAEKIIREYDGYFASSEITEHELKYD